jgi:hypothetical protein
MSSTRARQLRAVIVLGGVWAAIGPSPALASSFEVTVRILCPASFLVGAGPGGATLLDPTFATAVNLPCAGIRVVAMDSDRGFDEYCGAGYTDARGTARFRAECGDMVNRLPEVYLRIEGRSVNGFSVGVAPPPGIERILQQLEDTWERFVEDGAPIPVPLLDELRAHQTFAWLSPLGRVRDGTPVNAGTLAVGGGGAVSFLAARQFSAAQYAMFRLGAGTRYRPMPFYYNVNVPIPSFALAFTAYDTVVVDRTFTGAAASPATLATTAHEIGHVLYNTYHSDVLHWVGDALDIFGFRASPVCGSVSLGLAWYEGFADFVRDYVHQLFDFPSFTWVTAPPPPGCAAPGAPGDMSVEGDVEGLLNNVFFGPVRMPINPTSGPLAFSCPDGSTPVASAASGVPGGRLGGAPECTVVVPGACPDGTLVPDLNGLADACAVSVEDRRCAAERRRLARTSGVPANFSCPYDPTIRMQGLSCSGGPVVVRGGPDGCPTRVPATHSVPAGNPRLRPDGSPDMMLAAAASPPGGLAWFSLPVLDDVMAWVDTAGIDAHRGREFWLGWIRPWCLRADGSLRRRYCDPTRSPTFLGELTTLDPALF